MNLRPGEIPTKKVTSIFGSAMKLKAQIYNLAKPRKVAKRISDLRLGSS